MNSTEAKEFFAAIKTFVKLGQENSNFFTEGPNRDFKTKILATFKSFKLDCTKINSFVSQQQQEKKQPSNDSGFEDNSCDPPTEKSLPLITKKDLWQFSSESFRQGESDQLCAQHLVKQGSYYASQAVLFYQQSVEKHMKALWLLEEQNVSNLLWLRKNSKSGWQSTYYQSHDLVFLAKGLPMRDGKRCLNNYSKCNKNGLF